MEQKTIRLNLDLSFVYGPRTFRVPLAALMMLAAVGELNSESVTLSTYYPAPSGVYTNMITTGNTFLARDGGGASRVGVGTTAPGAKLSVSGSMAVGAAYAASAPPADSVIVSGSVGIGLTNPGSALDVVGTMKVTRSGCTESTANNGSCAGGRYITWNPGHFVAGTTKQGPGVTVTPSPLGITLTASPYYCCPN